MMKRILTLAALLVFFCATTQAATLKDLNLPDKMPKGWTLEASEGAYIVTIPTADGDLRGTLTAVKEVKRSQFSDQDLKDALLEVGKPMVTGFRMIDSKDYFSHENSEYKNNVYARQVRFLLTEEKNPGHKMWAQFTSFYYKDQVYTLTFTDSKNHTDDYVHQFLTSVFGSENKRRFDFDNDSFEF